MNREVLIKLWKLKLEALGLMTELLPEPVRDKAAKHQQDLIQLLHRVTGEYLEKAQVSPDRGNAVRKVEIQ